MTRQILDEIIDAIIQNDGRHAAQPRSRRPFPQQPRAKSAYRPEWTQQLPGTFEESLHAARWPRGPQYAAPSSLR